MFLLRLVVFFYLIIARYPRVFLSSLLRELSWIHLPPPGIQGAGIFFVEADASSGIEKKEGKSDSFDRIRTFLSNIFRVRTNKQGKKSATSP